MVQELDECKNADIAEIEIIRHPQRVTIVIHTARPGVIIGAKGANIEKIGAEIQKKLPKKVQIKIKEIKRAEVNASLIAQNVARQLVNRGSFRKALKLPGLAMAEMDPTFFPFNAVSSSRSPRLKTSSRYWGR